MDDNTRATDESADESIPSKSQRKREAQQLVSLAADLVELSPKKLATLHLPDTILEAVARCPATSTRSARKRHLQFIGKLLRKLDDPEYIVRAIQQQPSATKNSSAHVDLRDRLLDSLADSLESARLQYPDINLQQVRQLVRNSIAEAQTQTAQQADDEPAVSPQQTRSAARLLKLLQENARAD